MGGQPTSVLDKKENLLKILLSKAFGELFFEDCRKLMTEFLTSKSTVFRLLDMGFKLRKIKPFQIKKTLR